MKKIALACLAAVFLCGACMTAEELECWYDDWCKDFAPTNISPATINP